MEFHAIRELAEQGVGWASGLVGVSYCNGENGLAPSLNKGLKYLNVAADSGRPLACFEVGKMYLEGLGCDKNESKAEHYFMQALKKGHDESALALTFISQKRKEYSKALYYYILYVAYGGDLEHEVFETLNKLTKPEIAEQMHNKAEVFKQSNPTSNEIEMLGYSGVFVEWILDGGEVTSMSIAQEEQFLPIAVVAAREFIDTYREQNGL